MNEAAQETYNALLSGSGSFSTILKDDFNLLESDPFALGINFEQVALGAERKAIVKIHNNSSTDKYISDFTITMSINYGPDGTFTAKKLSTGNLIKSGAYAEFEITYSPTSSQQVWFMGYLKFSYGDNESLMDKEFSLRLNGTAPF